MYQKRMKDKAPGEVSRENVLAGQASNKLLTRRFAAREKQWNESRGEGIQGQGWGNRNDNWREFICVE